jgi:hypothetical protein
MNPTYLERANGELDIETVVCRKDGKINMIETVAYEISELIIVSILKEAI